MVQTLAELTRRRHRVAKLVAVERNHIFWVWWEVRKAGGA